MLGANTKSTPHLRRQRQVALLVARVRRQVTSLVELDRVDEQRHDHDVAFVPRLTHQREMAFVERAHRRHETDPRAGAPRLGKRGSQLDDGAYQFWSVQFQFPAGDTG